MKRITKAVNEAEEKGLYACEEFFKGHWRAFCDEYSKELNIPFFTPKRPSPEMALAATLLLPVLKQIVIRAFWAGFLWAEEYYEVTEEEKRR